MNTLELVQELRRRATVLIEAINIIETTHTSITVDASKEVKNSNKRWTPERRKKFIATMAKKRREAK